LLGRHSLSSRVELVIGKENFSNAYKIACVRNPYARAVSIWRHQSWASYDTFEGFVRALYNKKYPSRCAKWHSIVLSDHIFIDGPLAVQKIIRLETIQKDLFEIGEVLRLPNLEAGIVKTDRSNSKDSKKSKKYYHYYSRETEKMILEIYQKDFEIFGYDTRLTCKDG